MQSIKAAHTAFLLLISLLIRTGSPVHAQPYQPNWASLDQRPIPDWFRKAKFGIFIHWGTYSVPAYAPVRPDGYSEWYWSNLMEADRHSHKEVKAFHAKNYGSSFDYKDFASQFRAELFEPDHWAEVFRKSGARYVVLTSKHHEGFTLWPSAEADRSWGRPWNAVSVGPKRDLLGDLSKSVRKAGLKMGIYYSLYEWYNPVWLQADKSRFVNEHLFPQFKDVVTRYKPSVIFSDGEWDLTDTQWRSPDLLAWLYNESPVKDEVVVNDRWGKNTRKVHRSTYFTSEYGSGMDASVVWEENRGMGQSFGYNRMETVTDYKSGADLVLILADIVSRGGNLLLDIGPTADGRIPDLMEDRLRQLGAWLDRNGEAIFDAEAWTVPRQWSAGMRPDVREGGYQTSYDVSELTKPQPDGKAHINAFFTRKANTLYAIVPRYVPQLTLQRVTLTETSTVTLLGSAKKLPWKRVGTDLSIDLSGLQPGDVLDGAGVVKITAVKP